MPSSEPTGSHFVLEPLGSFSWEAARECVDHFRPLARHGGPDGGPLRMAFPLDRTFVPVAVALRWDGAALLGEVAGTPDVPAVARQVARIFALDRDGTAFDAVAAADPVVRPVRDALPGLRPVSFTSPYECAAWAVISQRISARQADAIQRRLVERFGERLEVAGGDASAFPRPERLLEVESVEGLAAPKIARLHAVARAALDRILDPDRLRAMGQHDAVELLRTIPGIGEFWGTGIYVRACGVADALPPEPIAIAALGRLHGLGETLDPTEVAALTDAYRPYRMWLTFLLRVAASRGIVEGIAGREMAIRRAARPVSRTGRIATRRYAANPPERRVPSTRLALPAS